MFRDKNLVNHVLILILRYRYIGCHIFLQTSEVSSVIMRTLTFLLFFLGFSCLSSVLADEESVDCSVVSLADVRKVIPDDAVNAKKFLYKIWKLSNKDFCRVPFEELHNMDIFDKGLKNFQSKTNEKVTTRNIIKYQFEKLMKDYEQSIWRFWVNNDGSSQMPGKLEGWKTVINQTLQRQFEEMKPWNYEFLVDALINELEEVIPNLDFLKSFTLNSQDVKKAIQGFVCTWQNEEHLRQRGLYLSFPDGFDEVMKTTGVENIDVEDTKAVVKKYMILSHALFLKVLKS